MNIMEKATTADENIQDQNRVFSRKCKKHPSHPLEFLYIKKNSDSNLICFKCAQFQKLQIQELSDIRDLFNEPTSFLFRYPPLKNETLYRELASLNLDQSLKDIEDYFKNLKQKIEEELEKAQQKAKSNCIQFQDLSNIVLEQYKTLSEPEKLKKLIISESESASKDLSDFINEKWAKSQENSIILQNSLEDMYQKCGGVSFDVPNQMSRNIIESIGKIDFFKKYGSCIERARLIKSTFQSSASSLICLQKDQNQQLEVKQIKQSSQTNQIFLDPLLDPLQNYVIQIEIENYENKTTINSFQLGIVPDSARDTCAYQQNMCYNNQQSSYGMTKTIKGNMWQQQQQQQNLFQQQYQKQQQIIPFQRSYEMRINIGSQTFRIATLPDFSSIIELDIPYKIDPKVPYRLFISMINQGSTARISKLETVPFFDDKMS